MDNSLFIIIGISVLVGVLILIEVLGKDTANKTAKKEQRQRLKDQTYRYYLELKNARHYPYWTMVCQRTGKIVAYKSHVTEEEAVAWLTERATFVGDGDPVIERKLTSA